MPHWKALGDTESCDSEYALLFGAHQIRDFFQIGVRLADGNALIKSQPSLACTENFSKAVLCQNGGRERKRKKKSERKKNKINFIKITQRIRSRPPFFQWLSPPSSFFFLRTRDLNRKYRSFMLFSRYRYLYLFICIFQCSFVCLCLFFLVVFGQVQPA